MLFTTPRTLWFLLVGTLLVTVYISAIPQGAPRQPGPYALGPDSLPQESAPKGRLEGPFVFKSKIIANTTRLYWVYALDLE